MAVTITEQLTKLNQLRQQLAANLTTKGVTATTAEKFNTLVPKVLEISGGESRPQPCYMMQPIGTRYLCFTMIRFIAWRTLPHCMQIFAVRRTTTL